jgi:hypothetical protein
MTAGVRNGSLMSHTLVLPFLYLICGVVIFLLGVTLLRVGKSSPPTRAAALMLFFAGLGPLLGASGMILQHTLSEGTVLFTSMLVNFEYLWEFYFPSLLLFALTFPREKPVAAARPRRRIPDLPSLYPPRDGVHVRRSHARGAHALAARDRECAGRPAGPAAHLGFDAVVGALVRALERIHRGMFALVNIVYAVVALDLLWRSQQGLPNRRPDPPAAHRRYRCGREPGVLHARQDLADHGYPPAAGSTALALLSLSLVASGGTIAYAVIRQQFLGVRHVLQRAALYGALAVVLGAVYLLAVRPVTSFSRSTARSDRMRSKQGSWYSWCSRSSPSPSARKECSSACCCAAREACRAASSWWEIRWRARNVRIARRSRGARPA